MSNWPWMKGVEAPIADPIPRVNEYDDRPSVKGLIDDHRQLIDEVKADLSADSLFEASKHDDLWILRFVMSHESTTSALKAAKATLRFRQENQLDEKDIRVNPEGKNSMYEVVVHMKPFITEGAIRYVVPDPQRGVIGLVRSSGIDQHGLVAMFRNSDWLPWYSFVWEWIFQWLDYVTRTTGRLTHYIRLHDMTGTAFSNVNREKVQRDARYAKTYMEYYPQLLQGLYYCNAPSWIRFAWTSFRPMIPQRVLSKLDFIAPHLREKDRKLLLRYVSEENLPAEFGGGIRNRSPKRVLLVRDALKNESYVGSTETHHGSGSS